MAENILKKASSVITLDATLDAEELINKILETQQLLIKKISDVDEKKAEFRKQQLENKTLREYFLSLFFERDTRNFHQTRMSAIIDTKSGHRPIFCYGSLMNEKVYSDVTKSKSPFPTTRKAVLRNYRRVKVKNQSYPAIYKNENSSVEGLLLFVEEKDVWRLDKYESDQYKRSFALVEDSDGKCYECDVYVWNKELDLLEDKDWSYVEFLLKIDSYAI